jgi:hypothetical protein
MQLLLPLETSTARLAIKLVIVFALTFSVSNCAAADTWEGFFPAMFNFFMMLLEFLPLIIGHALSNAIYEARYLLIGLFMIGLFVLLRHKDALSHHALVINMILATVLIVISAYLLFFLRLDPATNLNPIEAVVLVFVFIALGCVFFILSMVLIYKMYLSGERKKCLIPLIVFMVMAMIFTATKHNQHKPYKATINTQLVRSFSLFS